MLYNVYAAGTGRCCYIGTDYRSGGRLAANFIGKALELKQAGRALAVGFIRKNYRFPAMPDINSERLAGFLSVMKERYPCVSCAVEQVDTKTSVERQIMQIL